MHRNEQFSTDQIYEASRLCSYYYLLIKEEFDYQIFSSEDSKTIYEELTRGLDKVIDYIFVKLYYFQQTVDSSQWSMQQAKIINDENCLKEIFNSLYEFAAIENLRSEMIDEFKKFIGGRDTENCLLCTRLNIFMLGLEIRNRNDLLQKLHHQWPKHAEAITDFFQTADNYEEANSQLFFIEALAIVGNATLMRVVLEKFPSIIKFYCPESQGISLLHSSVRGLNFLVVDLLLKHRADPNSGRMLKFNQLPLTEESFYKQMTTPLDVLVNSLTQISPSKFATVELIFQKLLDYGAVIKIDVVKKACADLLLRPSENNEERDAINNMLAKLNSSLSSIAIRKNLIESYQGKFFDLNVSAVNRPISSTKRKTL